VFAKAGKICIFFCWFWGEKRRFYLPEKRHIFTLYGPENKAGKAIKNHEKMPKFHLCFSTFFGRPAGAISLQLRRFYGKILARKMTREVAQ
jgi:hypothetical protein